MKKSQATIFITICIVLILTSLLIFKMDWLHLSKPRLELKETSDKSSIINYMENCLDLSLEEGIRTVLSQGGYYQVPSPYESFSGINIPYYVSGYDILYPSVDTILKSIGEYMEQHAAACGNGFQAYKNRGYNIMFGAPEVRVYAAAGGTKAAVHFPITFSRVSESVTVSDFSLGTDIDVARFHQSVESLMEFQKQDPFSIPLSDIGVLSYENDFAFDMIYLDRARVLYNLAFEAPENTRTIKYNFMANYSWSEDAVKELPRNETIETQTAFVGKEFTYTVPFTGKGLLFTDYTELFDIDRYTGVIDFTPQAKDAGTHYIVIKIDEGPKKHVNIFVMEILES